MDDIDLILAGMQRELEEQEREIPAIRGADQLRSDISELKRDYQRFTPIEQAWQADCFCETTPQPPQP